MIRGNVVVGLALDRQISTGLAAMRSTRQRRATLHALLVLGLVMGPLAPTAHAADAGEELSVHLLTIGPGDHPFFTLGESAIWIQDERASSGVVYDFGPVKPASTWSLLTWLSGRLANRLSRVSIQEALETYRRANRTVETQDLELPPAARVALRRELELNVLPDNRDYPYDPFLSSGATRVRDALDRASGGRLRAASQGVPSGPTLREQALRVTHRLSPAHLIVYLGLGAASDRPLDHWGRMCLPDEIQKTLRRIGRAGSWNDPPLVGSEATIFAAHRDLRPQDPAGGSGRWWVLAGLAMGTALALAGRAARRQQRRRIILGALVGVIGLVLGLLGSALLLGWCFGDHLAVRRNENILQLAPWALVLPVLAVGVAAGRPGATRQAFRIAAAAAALAGVGLLLKATPWFRQDNLRLIGLFLPVWAGLALGLGALDRE
jgi:hypothetical protein